jgi:hypothetical protein
MLQTLASHNDDIDRLLKLGCALAVDSHYLIVRDIPYLNHEGSLQIGAIVTKLVHANNELVRVDNHQVFFAGSSPFGLDGKPIAHIGDNPVQLALGPASADVVVQRQFSYKLKKDGNFRDYKDFFEKIKTYITVISGPAIQKFQASPYTFRLVDDAPTDSPFKFRDTLTSRAEITDLSAKFKQEIVAIIGAGGTGAYVLDLISKTPVREIRLFDLDDYHVHNAFRSPGTTISDELNKPKVEVYKARYESFREGVVAQCKHLDETCAEDLERVTFAFVCVDKGASRKKIMDLLISMNIPFIDVGMGLKRRNDKLTGEMRTTYFAKSKGFETQQRQLVPISDNPNDIYKTNIQTAELNALNACIAVIRYKQTLGFYAEDTALTQIIFRAGDLKSMGDE